MRPRTALAAATAAAAFAFLTACAGANAGSVASTVNYPPGYQFGWNIVAGGTTAKNTDDAVRLCIEHDQQKAYTEGLPLDYNRNDGWLAGCADGMLSAPQNPHTDPPIPTDIPTNGAPQ
jgi:hypothetical protein